MRQTVEQQTAAAEGSGESGPIKERDPERLRPEGYSVDEDIKTVFDRLREAIAARHALAVLVTRKRWAET